MSEEYSMEAIIGKSTIAKTLEVAGSIASETKMQINEDGFAIRLADPANVACTFIDVDKPAFESYYSNGGTIGYSLDQLDDVISYGDSGDLVHLGLNNETRMLDIQINNFDYEYALIDPDSVRGEASIPDGLEEEMLVDVTVEASDIKDAVKAAELASDHVLISSDADDGEFTIGAKGDTDQTTVSFGPDEILDGTIDESCSSLFSLDYLKDLTRPIPGSAEVRVRHAEEMPTILDWDFAEGHAHAQCMIAPRIQND